MCFEMYLIFISGDLGKELKNLISIMDQEEAAEAVAANARTAKYKAKIKKWFPWLGEGCLLLIITHQSAVESTAGVMMDAIFLLWEYQQILQDVFITTLKNLHSMTIRYCPKATKIISLSNISCILMHISSTFLRCKVQPNSTSFWYTIEML